MPKLFISNEDRTERLFKSDFLEFFSKVHWTVPLIIYVPLISYFIYTSLVYFNLGVFTTIIPLFLLGIFSWTILEYFLHRFLFHYHPKTERGKNLIFIFHGIHHAYPKDSLRLVMPPAVSIPLAVIFYSLSRLIFGHIFVNSYFPGMLFGYLAYDITHFAIHHFAIRHKFWKKIKDYHMFHHYKDSNKGFGVSQPFWDYVFGTKFRE